MNKLYILKFLKAPKTIIHLMMVFLVFINTLLHSPLAYSASENSPSATECLKLGSEKSFGSVNNSDWSDWISPESLNYTINPKHLSVSTIDGKKVLRQRFVPSNKGSERVIASAGVTAPSKTFSMRQSVYVQSGFDWGNTSESGKIGFGLADGSAPAGIAVKTDGFIARFAWFDDGEIALYLYSADRSSKYGRKLHTGVYATPGSWMDMAIEITMNSATDKSDGTFKAWINGAPISFKDENVDNIQWQSSGGDPVVDKILYFVFHGGGTTSNTGHVRFADACWTPEVYTDEFFKDACEIVEEESNLQTE